MSWQDIVITIANLIFTFSLGTQVWHGYRTKKGYVLLLSSGLTSLGLYAICVAFISLALYFSVVVSFINATLWLILFIQRIIYRNAEEIDRGED